MICAVGCIAGIVILTISKDIYHFLLLESAVYFTNIPHSLAVVVIIGTVILLYVYWKKKHTCEYIEVNTPVVCEVKTLSFHYPT